MTLPAARLGDPTVHGGVITMGFPQVLIGGKPAARIGDMHNCPMVTVLVPHVGGPLILGAFTVLTGMMPQSRQTDLLICVGPPDAVMMGEPTVLVGMVGSAGVVSVMMGLAAAGGAMIRRALGRGGPRSVLRPDGTTVTKYNDYITIEGSPEYQAAVVADLDRLAATKTGAKLIEELGKTGHNVTIRPIPAGQDQNNAAANPKNRADDVPGKAQLKADGTRGTGADSVVDYNPSRSTKYTGEDGKTYSRDPYETLGHEMTHGLHQGRGEDRIAQRKPSPQDNNEEMRTIGLKDGTDDFTNEPISERKLSEELGKKVRPDHNSITESTYQDDRGRWHHETTDATGTHDTIIPAPPNGLPNH